MALQLLGYVSGNARLVQAVFVWLPCNSNTRGCEAGSRVGCVSACDLRETKLDGTPSTNCQCEEHDADQVRGLPMSALHIQQVVGQVLRGNIKLYAV
jgi:hypothetical protein